MLDAGQLLPITKVDYQYLWGKVICSSDSIGFLPWQVAVFHFIEVGRGQPHERMADSNDALHR